MSKRHKQQKNRPAKPRPVAAPAWYQRFGYRAAILFAFALALYANTLGHDYALDDAIVITENVITQRGPAGWGELFGNDTFYGFFQDRDKLNLVSGGRYRPLSLAFFGLEAALSEGPFVHHLFNLLWYGGVVVLLFGWLTVVRRQRGVAAISDWFPFLAALLFAAHPIHTEVVANIKGRDEIMALAGCLAAAWLTWRAVEKDNFGLAAAAAACFFLGLLSKETAITFLAVLPLSLLLLRKFDWNQLTYLLPTLAAAVVFLIIRASVLDGGGGGEIRELMNNPFLKLEGGRWVDFTYGERAATVLYGLGKYLQLLFFPLELSHDYYPRAFGIPGWGDWPVWLGALANLGLLVFGFLSWRKRPWVSLGILTYFATLSIVSNVFFPVGTLVSERFLFFPSVGLVLALGYFDWRSSKPDGKAKTTKARGKTSVYILLAVTVLFSLKTISRNAVWKNNYTLFTTDVAHQPGSAKLQNAAAGSKLDRVLRLPTDQHELPDQQKLLTESVGHADRALSVHPTYKQAYVIRGTARLLLRDYDPAIADFDRALEIDPNYADAAEKRLIAYRNAGQFYGEKQGDLVRSRRYLQRAYELQPDDYETLRLLGVLNGVGGQRAKAIEYFTKATEARPELSDAWWNLAVAYYQNNDPGRAEQFFNKARELEPGIDARKRGR